MLEDTFKGHLVQASYNKKEYLPLDQVAQSPIQPDLECFQGWGIYHLSGQLVSVFHYLYGKKFLPSIQSESTHILFKNITASPITADHTTNPVPVFLISPF